MQSRVTVENWVLTAGNHAAVIPPIADAIRNRQIRQQGAGLDLLKDALAQRLLIRCDGGSVVCLRVQVVEDFLIFFVAHPLVMVNKSVAVILTNMLNFFRDGDEGNFFCRCGVRCVAHGAP